MKPETVKNLHELLDRRSKADLLEQFRTYKFDEMNGLRERLKDAIRFYDRLLAIAEEKIGVGRAKQIDEETGWPFIELIGKWQISGACAAEYKLADGTWTTKALFLGMSPEQLMTFGAKQKKELEEERLPIATALNLLDRALNEYLVNGHSKISETVPSLEEIRQTLSDVIREELPDPNAPLDTRQAIKNLNISKRKLEDLIAQGKLKPIKVGRKRLFSREQLDGLLRQAEKGAV